jgi:hypothetical protein
MLAPKRTHLGSVSRPAGGSQPVRWKSVRTSGRIRGARCPFEPAKVKGMNALRRCGRIPPAARQRYPPARPPPNPLRRNHIAYKAGSLDGAPAAARRPDEQAGPSLTDAASGACSPDAHTRAV